MKFFANGHADSLILQTRAHHVQLSSMADVKASMLITLSSVLLTLSVPRVQKGGQTLFVSGNSAHWALIVLMTFSLMTILLAAYAAMPKYSLQHRFSTLAERKLPHFNLLFFGDFSRMKYPDFKAEMEVVLNDSDRIYEVQLRELHSLGVFLATTKYHYLRLAYLSFMSGLVASFLTFLLMK